MARSRKYRITKERCAINPALFALHAGSDLGIWREIEGQRVIHSTHGQGTVVKIAKCDAPREKYGAVRITVRFEQPSKGEAETRFAGGNCSAC